MFLKVLLAFAGILLAVLLVPVHLRATFNGDLKVTAGVLFLNFKLYPKSPLSEKKRLKKIKKEKKEQSELSKAEKVLKREGVWAVIQYYIEMGKLLKSAAKRLVRAITVDKLYLNILVATGDAAQTAIDYGKICAVVYPVQALIESSMRVRRRSINISTDFLRSSGEFEGEIKIHAIPVRVLWAILLFFIGYLGNTTSDFERIGQQ